MDSKCDRICDDCRASFSGNFKKIANLQSSGLVIYVHKTTDSFQWSSERRSKTDEVYMLHNTSYTEVKKSEYFGELCQYKGKCFHCKRVIHKVRSLLNELTDIRDIKENHVLGFCEHCRRTKSHKCPRCEYIVSKFMTDKVSRCDEKQKRFKVWLCRVRQLLQAILDGSVCKYKIDDEPGSTAELQYLLTQLKAPLAVHEPISSDLFPIERDLTSMQNITASKEMIDKLILKLKAEEDKRSYSSEVNLSPTHSKMCICKYFKDKDFDGVLPDLDFQLENDRRETDSLRSDYVSSTGMTSAERMIRALNHIDRAYQQRQSGKRQQVISRDHEKNPSSRLSSEKSTKGVKKIKEQISTKDVKRPKEKLTKEHELKEKEKIQTQGQEKEHKTTGMTEEEKLFMKLAKSLKAQGQRDKIGKKKPEKERRPVHIADLPELIERVITIDTESWSFINCEDQPYEPAEMIKGEIIVPYDPHYKDIKRTTRVPLLFETSGADVECPTPLVTPTPAAVSTTTAVNESIGKASRSISVASENLLRAKGAFQYMLSNRHFIENGITQLPTERVMRKMNVYKMSPSHPNWFKINNSSTKYYDTNEILAEVDEDGSGKWYYKNGGLALDYHKTTDDAHRYVVYSCGVDMRTCRRKPQAVLACFDFLGNGVVYDDQGNVRLKYNQTEGLISDEKIAPRGKWKWHDLNDPPVLEHIYIDTNLKRRDPILEKFLEHHETPETTKRQQEQEAYMLSIELDNYVKEKSEKLLQKFKPFQIRLKAVKINEQFALRILDQENIRLQFRDGATSLRLNLGLKLVSNEIIDIDTAHVSEVETPYDKKPPKSKSVANIQKMVDSVRKKNKERTAPEW